MPDYKTMYLKLFRATEDAINMLENVQKECEDMYINAPETPLRLVPPGEGPGQPQEE